MEARLEFNGMQYRLNSYVQDSIGGYRKREKSLEKIEELSRKDAWAVAMEIKLMPRGRLSYGIIHVENVTVLM